MTTSSMILCCARYCPYLLAYIQACSTAYTPSTRSIADVSAAILPALAVRKVLYTRTVLSLRVYGFCCAMLQLLLVYT